MSETKKILVGNHVGCGGFVMLREYIKESWGVRFPIQDFFCLSCFKILTINGVNLFFSLQYKWS